MFLLPMVPKPKKTDWTIFLFQEHYHMKTGLESVKLLCNQRALKVIL